MKRVFLYPLMFVLVAVISFPTESQSLMPRGFHDDQSGYIEYGSGWSYATLSTDFEGGAMWSQTFGSNGSGSFTFWGTGFTIYYQQHTINGSMGLCIDSGGSCPTYTINMNGTNLSRRSFRVTGLSDGQHIVTFGKTVNDTSWINIDAIRVSGTTDQPQPEQTLELTINITLQAETTPEPTPLWREGYVLNDPDGNERVVAFDYIVTVGDVVTGGLLMATLVMCLSLFVMMYRRK